MDKKGWVFRTPFRCTKIYSSYLARGLPSALVCSTAFLYSTSSFVGLSQPSTQSSSVSINAKYTNFNKDPRTTYFFLTFDLKFKHYKYIKVVTNLSGLILTGYIIAACMQFAMQLDKYQQTNYLFYLVLLQ